MDEPIAPVILAGGSGTRLWPLSTDDAPKQFQAIIGNRSTFAQALDRVGDTAMFLPPTVMTAARFVDLVDREWQRQGGPRGLTVLEPSRRDSAAAMAAAALLASRNNPQQLLLVLAADHLISNERGFIAAVRRGVAAARSGDMVTFGVRASGPVTAFGYIQPGPEIGDRVFKAKAFFEKPDFATAQHYVSEGYLWNSGNFLFRADIMIAAFDRHAPDIIQPVRAAIAAASQNREVLTLDAAHFAKARATSVDYAIMENISDIAVVEAKFSWSDIGSWQAVGELSDHDRDGNAIIGHGLVYDAHNCLIHSRQRMTVAAGVRDLAIIVSDDAVLVIPKARSQDVKTIAAVAAQRGPSLRILPSLTMKAEFPKPVAKLAPQSFAYEVTPLVAPSGFREYDARWWFGHAASSKAPEINLMGVTAIGLGIGTMLRRRRKPMRIVTGHDYRAYSQSIKQALINGLMASGCRVYDIGLAVTPMAYFAQFALDVEAVAMVTASHNENGWTGIKMGCERPVTFGPGEMAELRDIVLAGDFVAGAGGSYKFVSDFAGRYIGDLASRPPFARKLKVVVACGNGTAGAFAPRLLERLGAEVVPVFTELDHRFPNYNPNPEDMAMLHHIASEVTAHGADVGLGFDGDGDRCGVVDNEGHEIFADKIGLMLARDLAARHGNARFVVDVKSTCLYADDAVLRAAGATTDYFKTGHSYIKRRVQELGAIAGFEKSGHFFFNAPVGRGYDDGLLTAIVILDMLSRNPERSLADLYRDLPETWASPTMSAHCADEVKYDVVDCVTRRIVALRDAGEPVAGAAIAGINTINGVRVTLADGTWGLVRASSNKPEIVVVIESPRSRDRLLAMFRAIDGLLRENPEVGSYNQTL